jgi:hypothetical protein
LPDRVDRAAKSVSIYSAVVILRANQAMRYWIIKRRAQPFK